MEGVQVGDGMKGVLVRLMVQIRLCTYCQEEGGTEEHSRLDGGKWGWMGLAGVVGRKDVWRWLILAVSALEVRGGGVEAGSLKV